MSKHTLSSRKTFRTLPATRRPMMDGLEARQLMSVAPSALPHGSVNDTVYDANTHTLHVMYYDTADRSLKYQSFGDDGTSSQLQTVDNTGNAGAFLSMTADTDGILHAAYYDAKNGDLKYARRDLAGVWSTQTIDAKNTVGLYPSIALGADDMAVITYYYKNSGDLRMARQTQTGWKFSTLASAGDVGRYSSLKLNPATNRMAVAYEDTTDTAFMYAEQSASGWLTSMADGSTKYGGGYISLDFGRGLPAISYYDAYNSDLKFAERSSRGKWNATTVASHNSQGLYSDLSFTYNTNQPAIVYYNKTQDTVVLAYRNTDNTWGFETEVTGGGREVQPADGTDNGNQPPSLYLAWYDSNTGGLKVETI
jgi:hypothetical protein